VVPIVLSRIYRINNEEGAEASARLFLYAAFSSALIATLFGLMLWLGADLIAAAILPGLGAQARPLFEVLLLTSVVTPLGLAAAHFMSLVNRLTDNGAWYSVSQILTNSAALAGLILGYRYGGAFEAAVGMMAGLAGGAVAVCILQTMVIPGEALACLKLSARRHGRNVLSMPQARTYWSGVGVLVLAALVQEVYIYVDFYFASSVGEGSVGLVGFASRLAVLVNTLVVASAFVIIEPRWARALADKNDDVWDRVIAPDVLLLLSLLATPAALLFFYASDVTRLIYGSDQFAAPDREMLNWLTWIYSLSIIGLSLLMVTSRLLILLNQQRVLVIISMCVLPGKLVLSASLVHWFGLPGLAISTVAILLLQGICNMAFLVYGGNLTFRSIVGLLIVVCFTIIFGVATWLVPLTEGTFVGLIVAAAMLSTLNISLATAVRYLYMRIR
jgi:putative peptidoglycan lipid II flippase